MRERKFSSKVIPVRNVGKMDRWGVRFLTGSSHGESVPCHRPDLCFCDFLPTTVTPFPVFTMLFSAASFSFLSCPFWLLVLPPVDAPSDGAVVFFAYLSTPLSNRLCVFFLPFFSFARWDRFSCGVSSDLAAVAVFEAEKTSSGARRDDTDLRVGSADSSDVEGIFERVVIAPFGYGEYQELTQNCCYQNDNLRLWE
jgi:hypothetical protein